MQQRPNASWHEDRAGSPLGRLLVAPPKQLAPQHARAQSVQMPTAPQHLAYGSVPPGIAQSERFTGAVAQHQPMSQILPPPDFVAPSYSSGGFTPPRPPTAAPAQHQALLGILGALLGGGGGGSASTGTTALGGGASGGGGSFRSPPPVTSFAGSNATGSYTGGYTSPTYAPTQNAISGALGGGGSTYIPLSSATLSAVGKRGVFNV